VREVQDTEAYLKMGKNGKYNCWAIIEKDILGQSAQNMGQLKSMMNTQ
jgi:hypothetical protein